MKLSRVIPIIGASILFSATAFAASSTNIFTDVSADHENANAISTLKTEGVIEGYADGSYKPDATINRAEFTKIVVKANYSEEDIDDLLMRIRITFMSDIESGSWYERYVNAARGFGIVSGYADNTFKPGAQINVAEAAKIIAEAYDLSIPEGDVWYEGYIRALAEHQAIPLSIKTFSSFITRGEMAEIMYRLENTITTKPSHTFETLNQTIAGDGCIRTGCSGQICSDEEMVSTCEWRAEYQCYKSATCERQDNGQCGWTETEELSSCLAAEGEPMNPCAAVLCPANSRCEDGACIPLR